MEVKKIKEFTKGWFIGDFSPTLHPTSQFEIALKEYPDKIKEKGHVHKIGKEFTLFVSGKFRMDDIILEKGDILVIEPGEPFREFECIEPGSTLVVKIPSVKGDKYPT